MARILDKNTPWADNASNITPVTDSSGGTASNTIASVTAGASYSQADMTAVKNALATLAAKVNALLGERNADT